MNSLFQRLLIPLVFGLGASAQAGNLIAWWDFNTVADGFSRDPYAGNLATLMGGAAYTDPGGGRTGEPGDRGMRFGTGQQRLYVGDASFLNAIGETNTVSIAYWQRINSVRNMTNFFANSATVARALSTHTPWSNQNIYWDTAGCCDGGSQRIEGNPGLATWTDGWHHVVLVKSEDMKLVYVDGVEVLSGFNTGPFPTDFTELVIGNATNLGEAVDGVLDDVAFFNRELSPEEIASLAAGATPASLEPSNDADGDGLPDAWELRFAPNLTVLTPEGDADGDGLSNATEFALGTNPTSTDTDGDGLLDNHETGTGTWVSATDTGTSPLLTDSDGDGLADGVETNTGAFVNASNTGTNPNVTDTDGDGFSDGIEVNYSSSNPVNNLSRPLRAGTLDLLAYWPFDDESDPETALDTVKGFAGVLQNGAFYTGGGGGRTGQPGDNAIDLGFAAGASTGVRVADAIFLNLGAAQNQIAVSFWQQLNAINNSSSFWGESAASGGRGINGHATWSDGNLYWDTSGCCDGALHRVSGPAGLDLVDPPDWHHFVFQKNGDTKEVWMDGMLVVQGDNTAPLPLDFTVLHIGRDSGAANITGIIDDFAVFADALTEEQIGLLAAGTPPNSPTLVPPNTDTDGDGMPDAYETAHGLNPNLDDRLGDLDADGLDNFTEFAIGTLPNNADTDGDGLKDGVETRTGIWVSLTDTGTDPLKVDTDGDGLNDGIENPTQPFVNASQPGTDPNKFDTDGDGVGDGIEIFIGGTNPKDPASSPLRAGELDLLAYWPFDDDSEPESALDTIKGHAGVLEYGAFYVGGGGGRTGQPGDNAIDLGFSPGASTGVRVEDANFLNLAASQNQIAVSFWQQLNAVNSSSSFWGESPSSSGTFRGLSGHATWGDGNFYWDTSGCCDGALHRVSGPSPIDLADPPDWHHFVFQKNGNAKEIWLNGTLVVQGINAAPLPLDFTVLHIGRDVGSANITGIIDDFAVFGDALTPEQIGRLADGESPLALIGGGGGAVPLAFTGVIHNAATNQITLTWTSQPGRTYTLDSSQTLATWPVEINDNIPSGGATTTYVHNLGTFPGGVPASLYYRVRQN